MPSPFTVHAPGRVNLVGEHIDYCGLPCFPMAIQLGITVEVTPRRDAIVSARNRDARFAPVEFTLSTDIPPAPTGSWGNYIRAAAQALVRRLGMLRGADLLVSSNLPVASGLSSSSALVVAIATAMLRASDSTIDPLELAVLLAEGERYVGTAGGGMDQAIIVAARKDHASRIGFDPLCIRHVMVPAGWAFIIASSLERAEKSGSVQAAYNERTRSTREAHRHLAARLGDDAPWPVLLERHGGDTLLDAASTLDPVSRMRLRHVVTEAGRVASAVVAMEDRDMAQFGRLMDQSHGSLRLDYEVSTPALDALVRIARDAGARGARLTGAGFGGSIVALAEEGGVRRVLDALAAKFYEVRGVASGAFVARPSAGALG